MSEFFLWMNVAVIGVDLLAAPLAFQLTIEAMILVAGEDYSDEPKT